MRERDITQPAVLEDGGREAIEGAVYKGDIDETRSRSNSKSSDDKSVGRRLQYRTECDVEPRGHVRRHEWGRWLMRVGSRQCQRPV